MEPSHSDNTINFNTVFVVAGGIAMTLAAAFVMSVYGYMDHTQSQIDLRVAGHSSMCLHERCWGPQGRWGQK